MNAAWTISQDQLSSRWLGVSGVLKLTVEAESFPALRESIEEAESMRACELAADEESQTFPSRLIRRGEREGRKIEAVREKVQFKAAKKNHAR